MANEFPEATARPRYKVTNLYDCDYLIDENSVVLLQANRPPTVADMEGVANRYNQLDALRAAAVKAAIPYEALLMDGESRKWIAPEVWNAIEEAVTQLRAALPPQPEELQ